MGVGLVMGMRVSLGGFTLIANERYSQGVGERWWGGFGLGGGRGGELGVGEGRGGVGVEVSVELLPTKK